MRKLTIINEFYLLWPSSSLNPRSIPAYVSRDKNSIV